MDRDIRHHFIGIGGAGMSAIATVLLEMGWEVSGSDLKESRYTRSLAAKGARILIGHRPENIDGAGVVVVSAAIRPENRELLRAREMGTPVLRRAEMLARLAGMRRTVAVAGTHGKTTTTSMISLILDQAGLEPTFLIGGELNDTGSNARYGTGEYLVAEADESDGSLLCLHPEIAVITNVEADHLDYYRSLEDIEDVFGRFLGHLPPNGLAILCGDEPNLMRLSAGIGARTMSYGEAEECQIRAEKLEFGPTGSRFQVVAEGEKAGMLELKVPGRHNVSNALAACSLGLALGIPFPKIAGALSGFTGVHRRFELVGSALGVHVVDDYAHHPTEVAATLEAASHGGWERVIAVFQPHRFSRLSHLHREFADAFSAADLVVVTDVYPAGEDPIPGITGKLLVDSVLSRYPRKPVAYLANRQDLMTFLTGFLRSGDLLLTMGAGDIGLVGREVLARFGEDDAPAFGRPRETGWPARLGIVSAASGPAGPR